eukprot:scaffold2340_cov113-Isochrysis_galbana.AAC.9
MNSSATSASVVRLGSSSSLTSRCRALRSKGQAKPTRNSKSSVVVPSTPTSVYQRGSISLKPPRNCGGKAAVAVSGGGQRGGESSGAGPASTRGVQSLVGLPVAHEEALGTRDAADNRVRRQTGLDAIHPAADGVGRVHDGRAGQQGNQPEVGGDEEGEQRQLDRLAAREGRVPFKLRDPPDHRGDHVVEGHQGDGGGQPERLFGPRVLCQLANLLGGEILHANSHARRPIQAQ